ncbi:hypothetical protein L2E82_26730 [Cichorium intybus]|uniref:Uncharacterized protein n=1 Tax=Cichorium intybus TaxID=13427 RepID=A0ACB9CRA7_CICIN|nr:hypothetical protein L2E82_26730 [Cichorium intybus]
MQEYQNRNKEPDFKLEGGGLLDLPKLSPALFSKVWKGSKFQAQRFLISQSVPSLYSRLSRLNPKSDQRNSTLWQSEEGTRQSAVGIQEYNVEIEDYAVSSRIPSPNNSQVIKFLLNPKLTNPWVQTETDPKPKVETETEP